MNDAIQSETSKPFTICRKDIIEYEPQLLFLKAHEADILSILITFFQKQKVEEDNNLLMERLKQYFEYLADFELEAETIPIINIVPHWGEDITSGSESYTIIAKSSQAWREAFMNLFIDYDSTREALSFLQVLLRRQDIIFNRIYEHLAIRRLVLSKENAENQEQMHTDRLNLIGKMASSMAHEIRNPLTSIAGFLKLIRQNIINRSQPQLLKYIDVIDDEFDAINMQITGFLSFSRNKAFEEKKIEISVMDLINSTLFLLIPRLTSDNINFTFNERQVCMIYAQKVSIQQVVSNIVSNAIDALITVKYQRELRILCSEDNEYVYITVINNGPEISQKMRETMFLPFMTDKENGTGLGLAICKEIMAKNNGKIDFISDAKETSFILSFKKHKIGHGENI